MQAPDALNPLKSVLRPTRAGHQLLLQVSSKSDTHHDASTTNGAKLPQTQATVANGGIGLQQLRHSPLARICWHTSILMTVWLQNLTMKHCMRV
jgi:hypothetical protein